MAFEVDPRLKLYSVANDCLNKFKQDFPKSELAERYIWNDYFRQRPDYVQTFNFTDPESLYEADTASCSGIFRDTGDAIRIPLVLYRSGVPYDRENRSDEPAASLNTGGHHDVILAPEIPPTIVPAGIYDASNQSLNDLRNLEQSSVGEKLGPERSGMLIWVVSNFAIDQVDLSSFDL